MIAHASYSMGQAKGAQCRSLDDMILLILLANMTCPFCDFLLSDNESDLNRNVALNAQSLAAIEKRVASITTVGENKCSTSDFAISPPWTRAFWAGIGLFACYWILFGFFLGSMVVEVCRDTFGTEDEFSEMGNDFDEHGVMNQCLEYS